MNRRKISAILVVATLLTYMFKVEPVSDARVSAKKIEKVVTPTAEPAEQESDEWLLVNKQSSSTPIDPRFSVQRLDSTVAAKSQTSCSRGAIVSPHLALQSPLAICARLQV